MNPSDPGPSPEAAAVLALVHGLSLESARVAVGAIVVDGLDADGLADALVELAESGWVVEWEAEGEPGVILTAWAAERLGLRLNADSSRWVDRHRPGSDPRSAYRERPHRNSGTLTVTEADLEGELYTPLEELGTDCLDRRLAFRDEGPGARRGPRANVTDTVALALPLTRGIGDRQWLEVYAEAIGYTNWSMGSQLPSGEVVLQGAHPWPQPGQRRGPQAPEATERAWGGPCWTCHGSRLRGSVWCDVCDRGPADHRVPHAIRVQVAASQRPRRDRSLDRSRPVSDRSNRGKVYRQDGGLRGGVGA